MPSALMRKMAKRYGAAPRPVRGKASVCQDSRCRPKQQRVRQLSSLLFVAEASVAQLLLKVVSRVPLKPT